MTVALTATGRGITAGKRQHASTASVADLLPVKAGPGKPPCRRYPETASSVPTTSLVRPAFAVLSAAEGLPIAGPVML